jgi:hypothetical protein
VKASLGIASGGSKATVIGNIEGEKLQAGETGAGKTHCRGGGGLE